MFITFEGPDGSGKSTQITLLAEHLTGLGPILMSIKAKITNERMGSFLMTIAKPSSLDGWYKLINSIYFYRNFSQSPGDVFKHLVEMAGGLSASASHKSKVTDSRVFLAKAVGWWLALCGQVGIRSVETMIWKKFPYVCPYCLSAPHFSYKCKRNPERVNKYIDWYEVSKKEKDNKHLRPTSLASWQRMFLEIYHNDDTSDKQKIFGRLAEELGELAEGIRVLPVSHAYFMNEMADVFAWLMRFANFDVEEHPDLFTLEMLEIDLWTEYPGQCRYCQAKPCKCPPILVESLGRLSREMPLDAFGGSAELGLFTYEEKIEIFRLGDVSLMIAGEQVRLNTRLLEEITNSSQEILKKVTEISSVVPENLETSLRQLTLLASQQQVTQESVDLLVASFKEAPSETRTVILGFLNGIASGIWAPLLIKALQGF